MVKPVLKIVENAREHRRVKIGLHGALCIPGKDITMVTTLDMSEGGIGIITSGIPLPEPGTKVKLQLDGVLSSGPQPKLDIYSMVVVRVSRKSIGLSFNQPSISR